MHLMTSTQMLMSCEENTNSLKNEKQKLKSEILTIELHLSEKETRIQSLQVLKI